MAEASYQMLENLSFCDGDRAKPPSIKGNCTNSLGPKKYNESFRGQISYSQSFTSSKVCIMLP